MSPLILIAVFIVSTILGYILISNVPSLLHTPLMSGMNALSGITILGAIVMCAFAQNIVIRILGCFAIIFAMINVAGGFYVTHKMLKMFIKKDKVN